MGPRKYLLFVSMISIPLAHIAEQWALDDRRRKFNISQLIIVC